MEIPISLRRLINLERMAQRRQKLRKQVKTFPLDSIDSQYKNENSTANAPNGHNYYFGNAL